MEIVSGMLPHSAYEKKVEVVQKVYFPHEIWMHVFSFLDSDSRSSFSKVCWSLYQIALAYEIRSMHACVRACASIAKQFLGSDKVPKAYTTKELDKGVFSGLLSVAEVYQRAFATLNLFSVELAKSALNAAIFSEGERIYFHEKDRRKAVFIATMIFRVETNLLPPNTLNVAALRQRVRSCDFSFARAALAGNIGVLKQMPGHLKFFRPLEVKRWWRFLTSLPEEAMPLEDRSALMEDTQKGILAFCYQLLHHRHVHEASICVCCPDRLLDEVVEIFPYVGEGKEKRILAYQVIADLAEAGRMGLLWHFACEYANQLSDLQQSHWVASCAILVATFFPESYQEALFFADRITSQSFWQGVLQALKRQQEVRASPIFLSIDIVPKGLDGGDVQSALLEVSLRKGSIAHQLPKELDSSSIVEIFERGSFAACATLLRAIERLDDCLLTKSYSFILEGIHLFLTRVQSRGNGVHDTYRKTAFGTLLSISVYYQRALPKRCHLDWIDVVNRWIFCDGVFDLAAWDLLTATSKKNLEVLRRAGNFLCPSEKILSREVMTSLFLDLLISAQGLTDGVAFELLSFVALRGKDTQKCFWLKGIYDKFCWLRPLLPLIDDFNFNPFLRVPSRYKLAVIQRSILNGNLPEDLQR